MQSPGLHGHSRSVLTRKTRVRWQVWHRAAWTSWSRHAGCPGPSVEARRERRGLRRGVASSRTRGVRRTAPRGGVCQLPRAGGSAFSMGGPRGAGRRASGNSGVRARRHPEPGRSWDRNPPLTVAPAVSKTGDAFPGRQHPHPSEVSGGLWDCPARGAGAQQGPRGRAPHPGPPTHCLLGGDTWQVKHSSCPSAHHGRSGGLCRQPATEQPAPPTAPASWGCCGGGADKGGRKRGSWATRPRRTRLAAPSGCGGGKAPCAPASPSRCCARQGRPAAGPTATELRRGRCGCRDRSAGEPRLKPAGLRPPWASAEPRPVAFQRAVRRTGTQWGAGHLVREATEGAAGLSL